MDDVLARRRVVCRRVGFFRAVTWALPAAGVVVADWRFAFVLQYLVAVVVLVAATVALLVPDQQHRADGFRC